MRRRQSNLINGQLERDVWAVGKFFSSHFIILLLTSTAGDDGELGLGPSSTSSSVSQIVGESLLFRPVRLWSLTFIYLNGRGFTLRFTIDLDLEKKGYIVMVSVSTPEAMDALVSHWQCNGYVKAHRSSIILDPF